MLPHGLTNFMLLLAVFLSSLQGCARPVLQTSPADEREAGAVLEAFGRFQETAAEACGCCLDAEIDAAIAVAGWFRNHTGKLSGYLQAMEPGYIKFIGLNPLGQPLLIIATDGRVFTSLNVYEEKAYTGSVHSETYRKIAPAGFAPGFSYYWLTGRLPPQAMPIEAVMRDREQKAFWLQIEHAATNTVSMVLFDPEAMLILRHVLRHERGDHLIDVQYMDYLSLPRGKSVLPAAARNAPGAEPSTAMCRVPARITVAARNGEAKIEMKLQSFLVDPPLSPSNFTIPVPDTFELRPVK